MLRALLAFALSRRAIIVLGLLVVLGGGLVAFSKINIEAYPNPAPVIVEITAQAPGLSAEEMERYYTVPLEVGVAVTPGVHVIRSNSTYGLSFVRVMFEYGVDYYFAKTQVANNLQQRVNLPNGVTPTIQEASLVGEIYRYQLVGPPRFGLTNLRTLQDWVVQRRLLTVPGVVQVTTWGGTTKTYDVEVDLHKLDAYGVTLPQILTALGNANINVGGRTINLGQQSINVRGVGLIGKVEDIQNVVLNAQPSGIPVLVKDVAKVSVGYLPRLGRAGRDDDDDVVNATVTMSRVLQTNEVLPRVKAEIQKINTDGTLPLGVRAVPYYDRGQLVSVTTDTVLHNVLFGCVLVFLIQWIFLGSLRSAIIVGANIPFALFFSVTILYLMGESANLLSIGAVDLGIIVDAAVILVENVFRNLQANEGEQRQLLRGYVPQELARGWTERFQMIFASACQVDKAILFSTAITLAAFLPLFTMQGVEGQIFSPMARTYAYALAGALISTFTVTPVLATFLLPKHVRHADTIFVRVVRALYEPALRGALSRRAFVVALGVAFLALVGGVLIPRLGGEFLPILEENNLWIRATMPPTISLEAGMPAVSHIRHVLRARPEVITVTSQHGRPDDGSDVAGFFNAEFFVPLRPADQWPRGMTKETLIKELQKQFSEEFPGVGFNFSQYIQDNIEEQLSGVKGANSVKIVGRDLATLEQIAAQVLAVLNQVRGVTDLDIFRVLGQPNLNITVDREKAARYGFNAGDVNGVIQAALGGTEATKVLEGDRQVALIARVAPEYRDTMEKVRTIKVSSASNGTNAYIPLSEIATISLDTGASYIYHERNQRYVPIKFSVRGRDLESTIAEAQERIARQVKLPQGYRIDWAGEFESLQQAKKRLRVIIPVSLALIMVLLYSLFGSVRDSLLALAGLPFAVAGGILALFVTALNFSISAAIGFVSLLGISVMNGILMLTYYNEVTQQGGMSSIDGMFHTASQRMRSVLMTSLSACLGLVPAAISTGIGSQVQRPLATVIVGGLLIGQLMLLVVVPALWAVFLSQEQRPTTEDRRGESADHGAGRS
ncbi:MAG TPA: CusA/CzcA family heavy metal efflux RND transporter [Methylomirabilota bacterium]|nr:CusA/CzcA family heavy metal efflux RND transporter [Methylomirabilota bacterium]